ncbi:MAG: SDR family oxidoreductase [Candidatus Latescibacteria bacterium]|nr:SDR family oxidoreductase [Candidatus Latescibacterota bacterium]
MELNLSGKVALVTGASEGIGRGIALKLAGEGCRVAMCARRQDVLASAAEAIRSETGAEVLSVRADVTQTSDLERLVNAAVSEFGGIDILVNNAGRSEGHHFEDATEPVWQGDFDLKFWAAVRGSMLAVPHMKARGGGSIVNITHPGGKAPGPGSVPTSVSRAAGIALTKAMSKDLAQHLIRVNTVCLTNIRSAQAQRAWTASGSDLDFDAWCEELGKDVPLGRMGEPGEVADLIAFLVSERGAFITGAAINFDGGSGETV